MATSTATSPASDEATLSTSRVARVVTELVGSFLVFLAIYAICSIGTVLNSMMIGPNILTIGLLVGLAYGAITYLFGRVSGAHLNPAVSLASVLLGRIGFLDFILYVIAQCLGAFGAAELIVKLLVMPTDSTTSSSSSLYSVYTWIKYAINGVRDDSPLTTTLTQMGISGITFGVKFGVLFEVAMTAIVVAIVLKSQNENGVPKANAWLVTALGYGVATAVAYPFTGAALNPARATGIALAGQSAAQSYNDSLTASASTSSTTATAVTLPLSQLWIFWVAPLLAAAVVALVFLVVRQLHSDTKSPADIVEEKAELVANGPADQIAIDAEDSAKAGEQLAAVGITYSEEDDDADADEATDADEAADANK